VPYRCALALLVALLALAGCLAAAPAPAATKASSGFAALTTPAFGFGKWLSLTATSFDGTPIHVDMILPNGSGPFPAFVTYTPYSILGDDETAAQNDLGQKAFLGFAQEYVPYGYAVGVADVRGTGESGGCLTVGGPEEGKDGYALVEFLANQSWSNGKVALGGTSWDGTTPLETAVLRPPHLSAIVSMSPVTEWYRYYFELGTHRRNADPFPGSSDTDPAFDAVLGGTPGARTGTVAPTKLTCVAQFASEDDAQDDYDAWWHARDHHANAANITTAVLYAQGWEDGNVAPTGIPTLLANLTGAQDWHAWLEQHGHGVPASKKDYYAYMHRFLDHELLGLDNGAQLLPRVIVEDNQGKFRAEPSWPPPNLTTLTYYPGASGKLSTQPGSGALSYHDDGTGRTDAALDGVDSLAFATDPLPAPLRLAGVPRLHLKVASDMPDTQFDVLLYDRAPDGSQAYLSRGYLDARHRDSLDHGTDMPTGTAVDVAFDLHPNDHVVPAGHAIVLVLKSTDDYVVRSPYRATNTITLGAGTRLSLPLEAAAIVADHPPAPWAT
jgi:X-Pro dipeptidyl-peptidase